MKRSTNPILSFVRSNLALISVTYTVGIIASFLNVLLPLSVGKFFEILYHEQSAKGRLIDLLAVDINDIPSFFIGFFILILLRGVFGFFQVYLTSLAGERFVSQIRFDLFKSQLTMSLKHFEKRHISRHLQKYAGDMRYFNRWITKGLIGGPVDFLILVFSFFALAQISLFTTVGLLISVLIIGTIMFFVSQMISSSTKNKSNVRGRLMQFVTDRLQGIQSVKFFNKEFVELGRFKELDQKFEKVSNGNNKRQAFLESVVPVFFFITISVVLWLTFIDTQVSSPSNAFTFILVLLYLQGPFKRLLRIPITWRQAKEAFSSYNRIVDQPRESRANKEVIDTTSGAIQFSSVEIVLNEESLLANFSASIPFNSIAFIQSEKAELRSKFLRIFGGVESPSSGEVSINGKPFCDFNPYQLRKTFTFVSEELPLVGETILEAISFYATEEKVEKVKRVLNSLGFKDDLLDSPIRSIGDNRYSGLNASDLLKLSFARAILTSKNVIILDNPFQGVADSEVKALCEVLHDLKKNRTIVLIAPTCPSYLHVNNRISL